MNKRLYILCWGMNADDQPHHMVHRNYYSSQRLALEAMDRLIRISANLPDCYAIAEDQYLNQYIGIHDVEMDHFRF